MPLVVTRAHALADGRTAREVDALVRSGRWVALRRAVYLTQSLLPDDPVLRHAVQVAAVALSSSLPVVASHGSAALLHGLPQLRTPERPVLTRVRSDGAARSAPRRAAALVASVPREHLTRVHGVPVTSVARTAVDLARTHDDVDAVLAVDAALRVVPRSALLTVLDVQRGWPGAARAVRQVAFGDGRAESALESLGRLRMAELGLPAPELQVVVGGADGPVARVDYLWREHRTVGEADGRLKYADRDAVWAEKRREDRLRDAGYEVVRFTWDEALRRPHVLAERALRAFARAAAHPAA